PEKSFIEIRFENNIFALYKLFDVFVHTPIDEYSEAFGQTYVEALASGIPAVVTLSGIGNDFIVDGRNALVAKYKDSDSIYSGICTILKDGDLSNRIKSQGREDVEARFSLKQMI